LDYLPSKEIPSSTRINGRFHRVCRSHNQYFLFFWCKGRQFKSIQRCNNYYDYQNYSGDNNNRRNSLSRILMLRFLPSFLISDSDARLFLQNLSFCITSMSIHAIQKKMNENDVKFMFNSFFPFP